MAWQTDGTVMTHPRANQMWACKNCGTERAWGFEKPDKDRYTDDFPVPLLGCKKCGKPTRHIFTRIQR